MSVKQAIWIGATLMWLPVAPLLNPTLSKLGTTRFRYNDRVCSGFPRHPC
jgi:hypothetical protein